MARLVTEAGVGAALDPYREDFADKLFAYYASLDLDAFEKSCGEKLKAALGEYDRGLQAVRDAVKI